MLFKKIYHLLFDIKLLLEDILTTLENVENNQKEIEKLIDLFYEQNTTLLDDIEKEIIENNKQRLEV